MGLHSIALSSKSIETLVIEDVPADVIQIECTNLLHLQLNNCLQLNDQQVEDSLKHSTKLQTVRS